MTNFQTLFDIQDLTAVITGGSGQLGRAMAQCLAEQGVKVAILSLQAETSEKVAELPDLWTRHGRARPGLHRQTLPRCAIIDENISRLTLVSPVVWRR